jgi:hypothetical protein
MQTRKNISSTPVLLTFAALLVTACSPAGFVEGVVYDETYQIRDDRPAARESRADTILVVLSEEDGERFRAVTIEFPGYKNAELGQATPIAVGGEDGPIVRASNGELVVDMRRDGVRILSSKNDTFADIVSGHVILDSIDDVLAGSFEAKLESGGYIRGTFAIER